MEKAGWMEKTLEIARESVLSGRGGPFGAVVVKEGKLIGKGANEVTLLNDPTAHAEIQAIREACRTLGHFQLDGCEIFTSCEPCPMCLGAVYWARPRAVYFAYTREDAAAAGFDDACIYEQMALPFDRRSLPMIQVEPREGANPFELWEKLPDKATY